MIKYILFDVMGVIFTVGDDVEGLLIPYMQSLKPEIPVQKIKELYHAASLGRVPSRELWELTGVEKAEIPEIERYYLEHRFSLDAGFLPCAKALKARYSLALLSNDIGEWSRHLRAFYGIEPLIDAAFISSDLGVRKPDPQIYQMALAALGIQASECVFIDDSPERVEAARRLGICSILFDREGHDYQGLRVKSFAQFTQLLL
ncbi:MAG: HAD family phosphatase [Clostridiales bacterium]|nr:HAD family phosphatase [Clostridiales bacterium]